MERAQAIAAEPEPSHLPHLRLLDPAAAADHLDRLYRAARSKCGSREEAEDLVQDTYVRLLSRPRRIRHDSDLPYLLRALRMTHIDAQRSRARRPQETELPEGVELADRRRHNDPAQAAELLDVFALIAGLPGPQRDVITAVDVAGLSYADAAQTLGMPVGSVMSRLFRARNAVAAGLTSPGAAAPRRPAP